MKSSHPLLVFSHGMFGSRNGCVPLATHWASHGYIVIQPTHGDSLSLMPAEERKRVRGAKSIRQLTNRPDALQHYRTRPRDISFVIDSIDAIEQMFDGLANKINRKRIGMGGHSFGAHTTLSVGGLAYRKPLGGVLSFEDKRPRAFLTISPPGPNAKMDKDAYAAIDRPLFVITGTNDKSPRTGQGPDWRKKVFEFVPGGDKYLLFIDGAYHNFGHITGRGRTITAGSPNGDHVAFVKSSSTAFWDAYLKGDGAALDYLKSVDLSRVTDGGATLDRK